MQKALSQARKSDDAIEITTILVRLAIMLEKLIEPANAVRCLAEAETLYQARMLTNTPSTAGQRLFFTRSIDNLRLTSSLLQRVFIGCDQATLALEVADRSRANLFQHRMFPGTDGNAAPFMEVKAIEAFAEKFHLSIAFYSKLLTDGSVACWQISPRGLQDFHVVSEEAKPSTQGPDAQAALLDEMGFRKCLEDPSPIRVELSREELRSLYGKYICCEDVHANLGAQQQQVGQPQLLICPDADLFSVPFYWLLDANDVPLISKFAISYMPSIRIANYLAMLPPLSRRELDMLIVCSSLPVTASGHLHFARQESRAIEALCEQHKLSSLTLNGDEATKQAMLDGCTKTCVLHIIAHGTTQKYTKGALLLADDRGKDDAVSGSTHWHFDEILDGCPNLKDVELVFVNCCLSGTGEVSSDGLESIGTAFLCAGARAVVVALSSPRDAYAAAFAERFYGRYFSHRSAPAALRETLLERGPSSDHDLEGAAYCIFGGLQTGAANSSRAEPAAAVSCNQVEYFDALLHTFSGNPLVRQAM